jgi:hypothetical protein
MNRLIWSAAALGAIGLLVTLALTGGRGGSGLAPFTPKGLMTIPLQDVREVDLETREGRWHFVRTENGWHATVGTTAAGFAARLDGALTLLRNSGPERILSATEIADVDPAQFGLDPPRLRVVVNRSGTSSSFAISFGATNVLGLSHYARREESREIALLPGFVAEEWERVGKKP